MRAGKAAVLCAGSDFVERVTEFVEERFHVGVCHERRFLRARWRKIAQERGYRPLIFAVWQKFTADDWKFGEVVKFSVARKHIEIKHAKRLAGGGIRHHVKLQVVDPFVRRGDFLELQTENALVNVEHAFQHFLEREKRPERFGIDVIFLFFDLVRVVAPIPDADLRFGIVRVFGLHFLEFRDFGRELWLNA